MLAKLAAVLLTLALFLVLSPPVGQDPELRSPVPDDPEVSRVLREVADVPADAWYAPSLAFLCRRGVFPAEGSFRPDAPMEWEDLRAALGDEPDPCQAETLTWRRCLAALHRAAGRRAGEDPEDWARGYGLLTGLEPDMEAVPTRAEAAVLLERFWRLG